MRNTARQLSTRPVPANDTTPGPIAVRALACFMVQRFEQPNPRDPESGGVGEWTIDVRAGRGPNVGRLLATIAHLDHARAYTAALRWCDANGWDPVRVVSGRQARRPA
jgi:hypothetical protein